MKTLKPLMGSTLLIAGTTIGAGMLALPLEAANISFGTVTLIMVLLWALMLYTAYLLLDLHQTAPPTATLHTLAMQYLGRNGQRLAGFAMLFLFYALCAAYMAGGGEQLAAKMGAATSQSIAPKWGTLVLTLFVAAVVRLGTGPTEKVNRVLFATKFVLLAGTIFYLAPNVSSANLTHNSTTSASVLLAIPVMFTSFGFHGSVPSIVRYLDGDTRQLKIAVGIGSALPLVLYVIWQWCTLGNLSQSLGSLALSDFIALLSQQGKSVALEPMLNGFADLALLTSFLGVSLGLFHYLDDLFKSRSSLTVTTITFLPPLMFALWFPQGFQMALGYAAIALALLAVLLPVAMQVKKRRLEGNRPMTFGLAGALCCGIGVIVIQLGVSFSAFAAS
uniref:aromatic amino acid transport family protein n=1 Tax=Thaumasiovibrio occultus TaxID=1891184 RepID=UPI000B355462|nr:aromatic amino acid transport family protein [Thaumasiovibrio occultus]